MRNTIKTTFRHDTYLTEVLEKAEHLTKLSKSELIRNACLGQWVPLVQKATFNQNTL
jgi:hypothetical protein